MESCELLRVQDLLVESCELLRVQDIIIDNYLVTNIKDGRIDLCGREWGTYFQEYCLVSSGPYIDLELLQVHLS